MISLPLDWQVEISLAKKEQSGNVVPGKVALSTELHVYRVIISVIFSLFVRYAHVGKVERWGVSWSKKHVQKGDGKDIDRIVLMNGVS